MQDRFVRVRAAVRLFTIAGGIAGLAGLAGLAGPAAAEPLTLEQCEELALRNNPGIAQARAQLRGTEASRLSSMNAFLPDLSYQLSRSQNTSGYSVPVIDPGSGLPVTGRVDDSYSHSVSVSQSLVNLPGLYRYWASGSDLAGAKESVRGSEADLIYAVRQRYFVLLRSILLEEVAKEALSVSEEQLRKSQALFEVGSVARSDVLQARVNRANAEREEIGARNAIDQERARLAVLLGMGVGEPLEIRQDVGEPPSTGDDEAALIGEALQAKPEVRRAAQDLDGARLRYRSAFWSQFPTVYLGLSYAKQIQQTGGVFDDLGDLMDTGAIKEDARWGWSVGLRWNIFDGFGTIGEIRRSRAGIYALTEARRQEELAAELAVREARIAMKNASEEIRAAEEAVAYAEENLKLQEALYQNGGGTILELNNAQVERTRAKTSLVDARIAQQIAGALLDRALGR